MDRREAIEWLKSIRRTLIFEQVEAIDLAIEALRQNMQTELDKDNRTLWVKTNSTETLDSIARVIVQGEHPWCKVFYEAYDE